MAQENKGRIAMILTRKILADMLMKYINHEIDLSSLVSWAEDMIKEACERAKSNGRNTVMAKDL